MISWFEKRGSVLLIIFCALVILFAALYTRQDDLKRAAAKNAAADQNEKLGSLPVFCAPVASQPTQSYCGVYKSESGLWQLDPYVRYDVKTGEKILSPCTGVIDFSDGKSIRIRAAKDLVFDLTGSFEILASGSVSCGQQIARCTAPGVLLFGLTEGGKHVDPLSLLTPREVF